MTVDISKYRKTFLGQCHGVGLCQRGTNDLHICVEILFQDDENWFTMSESHGGGTSSYWLSELISLLQEAHNWIERNCPADMHDGRRYGNCFRE